MTPPQKHRPLGPIRRHRIESQRNAPKPDRYVITPRSGRRIPIWQKARYNATDVGEPATWDVGVGSEVTLDEEGNITRTRNYAEFATSNGLISALDQLNSTNVMLIIVGKVDLSEYDPTTKGVEADARGNFLLGWSSKRYNMSRAELIERLASDPLLNPSGRSDPYFPYVLSQITHLPWTEVWTIRVYPLGTI